MPERSSKRKARRDSPVNSLDEPESSSMRTENAASLSDKDFTELSEKIEKSVSKRIKDAEVGQREILKMIENLTSKIDTLTERPSNNVRHGPDDEDAENTEYRYRLVEPSDLLPNHGQHIDIGTTEAQQDHLSSVPRGASTAIPIDEEGASNTSLTALKSALRIATASDSQLPEPLSTSREDHGGIVTIIPQSEDDNESSVYEVPALPNNEP